MKCISEKEDRDDYNKNNYDLDEIQQVLSDEKPKEKEEIDENAEKKEKEE